MGQIVPQICIQHGAHFTGRCNLKLCKQSLQTLFSIAKQNFVDDTKGDLDDQQFIAQCYVKALCTMTGIQIELPEPRIIAEPVE